jgi:hypothetical protein
MAGVQTAKCACNVQHWTRITVASAVERANIASVYVKQGKWNKLLLYARNKIVELCIKMCAFTLLPGPNEIPWDWLCVSQELYCNFTFQRGDLCKHTRAQCSCPSNVLA